MQQWEYKRCLVFSDEKLEQLGKDGWELAAIGEGEKYLQYIFKRPLPDKTEWVNSSQIPVAYRTGLQEGRSTATKEVCFTVLKILVDAGEEHDNAVKLLKEKYEPFATQCDSMKYWAKG